MGVVVSPTPPRLAQQALETDNAGQATWAGRQGLLATWAREECYRNLMRAAIHQDDRTALDAAKKSWESAASTNPHAPARLKSLDPSSWGGAGRVSRSSLKLDPALGSDATCNAYHASVNLPMVRQSRP